MSLRTFVAPCLLDANGLLPYTTSIDPAFAGLMWP
jgi:hypothetical protein